MIRFFKSPQPAALFSIPIIVIVLWGQHFSDFPIHESGFVMPLWELMLSFFMSLPSWLNLILFCALISFEAIYLNLLINKHEVIYKNSYLPALFFVLYVSSFTGFQVIHPLHLVNLIMLLIFDKMFSLYHGRRVVPSIFDSGFLAALATLLYLPMFPVLVLLMIALSLMRSFNLREWLVLLIAYFVPFMLVSVWKFWNDELLIFWNSVFDRLSTGVNTYSVPEELSTWVLGAILLFTLLISLVRLRINYYKNIIRARTYQQIQLLYFLTGLFCIWLAKEINVVHLLIFSIPVAIWFAYFFVSQKKKLWFAETLLWLLVASIIWQHVS